MPVRWIKAIRLVDRFAACFNDGRDQDTIEHTITTLIVQRVMPIVLGYEDLNDHDELRHDPIMAVLVAGFIVAPRRVARSFLRRLFQLTGPH